ncbi:MAG TPA: copper-binding protein [Burkholderiaceae bacterium]
MTPFIRIATLAAALIATAAGATDAALADGEVRRIDRAQGKVTLKHGEISNLQMPPMTMVFRAKDPAVLDRLKVGDKVRFAADQIDGAFTVTRIEPVK